jgi:hypothetical protein
MHGTWPKKNLAKPEKKFQDYVFYQKKNIIDLSENLPANSD